MEISLAYILPVFLLTIPFATCDDNVPIPADKALVNKWFAENVQPLALRKGKIDPNLQAAEDNPKTVKVRADGTGEFKTIKEALDSIPAGNDQRVIIWIGKGEYKEKIKVERTKPFITFYGTPKEEPTLSFGGTAAEFGTVDSASLIVESDYFVAANVIIANSAPQPDGVRKGAQAVAMRISGDKAAFYNCRFLGFQDTICDDRGFHFFKDCYIEGTVDFIFGSGTSIYLNTELHVLQEKGMTVITAHARQSNEEDTGYSFVHCNIIGESTGTFLGRAWMAAPRVFFTYTEMSNAIAPAGWSDDNKPQRDSTVHFGEFQNKGPGANPAGRAKFTKQLAMPDIERFISLKYLVASTWLLPPPKL